MGDHNETLLMNIKKRQGNNKCADCGAGGM